MEKIKSESDKRLIVKATVNDKEAYFLMDTGASIGMIDYNQRKKYDLKKGRPFSGTIVGAGGHMSDVYHCDTFVHVKDIKIPQFLLADISQIVESIRNQTGIKILGIISLPQMKISHLSIDCDDMNIIIE